MPHEGAAAAILDDESRLLLVKENYGRRRWGFPGGAVEPEETALEAVVRETMEEAGVAVAIDHVVGVYRLVSGLPVTLFSCSIVDGAPARPSTGEIDHVGWFAAAAIPQPVTNILHHALADVTAGRRGIVKDGLERIN